VQSGEWCADREPLLKAYAAGLADTEQRRQAQQHLSHCRHCSDFVGKLSGHLHDIGSAAAVPSAAEAIGDGRFSVVERLVDFAHRAKESATGVLARGPSDAAQETSTQTISVSGGARGAGAAGTGVLAKIAGVGTASKLTAMCLGGGVAATACLATGVVPGGIPGVGGAGPKASTPPAKAKQVNRPMKAQTARLGPPHEVPLPTEPAPDPDRNPPPPTDTATVPPPAPPLTTTTTATTTPTPIAPTAPPVDQEFDVASAASTPDAGSSSSGGGGGGSGSAVKQEFGP
jgi:hypothetical protein